MKCKMKCKTVLFWSMIISLIGMFGIKQLEYIDFVECNEYYKNIKQDCQISNELIEVNVIGRCSGKNQSDNCIIKTSVSTISPVNYPSERYYMNEDYAEEIKKCYWDGENIPTFNINCERTYYNYQVLSFTIFLLSLILWIIAIYK